MKLITLLALYTRNHGESQWKKIWNFLKISNKAFSQVGDGKPPRSQISYGVLIVTGKKCIGIPHWVHGDYLHYYVAKLHELILWELLLGGVPFPRRVGLQSLRPRGYLKY